MASSWSTRFADLPFRRKMLLLPTVSAAALGITLLVHVRYDLLGSQLSAQIENGYYPSQELSRDLEETLAGIQHGLQDAVASRDDSRLVLPDSLHEVFLGQMRQARANPVANVPELTRIEENFDDYYALARSTTLRMIHRETGGRIDGAVATTSKQYITIRQMLDTQHARDRHAVSAAFYAARHLHLLGAVVGVAISLACVIVVTALSLIVIKSLTSPVNRVVEVANRLAKGDLQIDIPVTSKDEIGQLLMAMREMVSYLREMAGVAELIAAGDISADVRPRSAEDSFGCSLREMSGYLREMAGVADRISAGDLTIDVVPRSKADRFGHAFLAMVAHLATNIEELQASESTNRQLTEHSSATRERLGHLLRSSPAVIYSRDLHEGRRPFTFVGQNITALLGCNSATIQEDPARWSDRVHVEDARQAATALNMAAELGQFACEYRVKHETGGYRWIHDEMRRVVGEGGGIEIVGWWLDVTERREAENALHQSETQLRLSQKMEAVGRLAGGIAHDFNNVLTAILSYSDMALETLEADNPLTEDILEIKKAAQRAANLTRQLLAFSRQQVLQLAVLDLNGVVVEMGAMLQRLIGEDVKLVVAPSEQGSMVRADLGQLQQVIMNLAVNARDAMPDGGSLTLSTSSITLDAATAAGWEAGAEPGPYVQLAVSDTGHGMSAEVQKKIFEPFFTTKEVGKGTGLGLATVYGIVRQSGGYILVDSTVGQGTTFRIYLPEVDENVSDYTAPAAHAPSDGTETILLVEDEESVRMLARRILQRRGYRVFDAGQAEEALVELARIPDTIDLLLTDVVMPGIRGPELAKQVTAQRPNIGVLYMSGYTDRDLIDPDPSDGVHRLLQKPFTPDGLATAVRAAIDEHRARAALRV